MQRKRFMKSKVQKGGTDDIPDIQIAKDWKMSEYLKEQLLKDFGNKTFKFLKDCSLDNSECFLTKIKENHNNLEVELFNEYNDDNIIKKFQVFNTATLPLRIKADITYTVKKLLENKTYEYFKDNTENLTNKVKGFINEIIELNGIHIDDITDKDLFNAERNTPLTDTNKNLIAK